MHPPPQRASALASELHSRPIGIALSGKHAQAHPRPRGSDLVQENPQPPIVVGYDKIHATIIVQVADCKSPPNLGKRERASRLGAHVLELSVAEVVQQLFSLMQRKWIMLSDLLFDHMSTAVSKMAVRRSFCRGEGGAKVLLAPAAGGFRDAAAHPFLRPARDTTRHATLERFVAKSAVLLVDPKLIRIAVIGYKDVRPATT